MHEKDYDRLITEHFKRQEEKAIKDKVEQQVIFAWSVPAVSFRHAPACLCLQERRSRRARKNWRRFAAKLLNLWNMRLQEELEKRRRAKRGELAQTCAQCFVFTRPIYAR